MKGSNEMVYFQQIIRYNYYIWKCLKVDLKNTSLKNIENPD